MKKLITILSIAILFSLSCRKAYDDTPKLQIIINSCPQPAYHEWGYYDIDTVFHCVPHTPNSTTSDSATFDGHIYLIYDAILYEGVNLGYEVRNIGYFEAKKVIVTFRALLENGTCIDKKVEVDGLGGCRTAQGNVHIDTKKNRHIDEISVLDYTISPY